MPIRTGADYLQSLRDDRHLSIDGERVKDVTTDPRFTGAAQTMAELLDLQHEPDLTDIMTFASPATGDKVGITHIIPQSKQDVLDCNKAIQVWMDYSCGMLGRSPDYKNMFISCYAAGADNFKRDSFDGSDNIRNYHNYVRENDQVITHVLVNPQVDRSRPAHLETSDIVAHITKETDAGFHIKGARMVATLCGMANELLVMPAASRWPTDTKIDTTAYSFGFAIPLNTPGLRFICRPPVAHTEAGSPADYPLAAKYDESDGLVIFDDVFVPWERVFLYRDPDYDIMVNEECFIAPSMLMQSVVRSEAKTKFMMALTLAIARSSKIDQHVPVQVQLAETIAIAEFSRTCRIAAEAECWQTSNGSWAAGIRPLMVWQNMFWKMYNRQCEIINTLAAGGLVAVPSFAEVAGELKDNVETYFQSANLDSPTRIKLLRLAYDASLSSFAGRQRLYEQFYTGDPMRTQSRYFSTYNTDEHIDRIHKMLDELG